MFFLKKFSGQRVLQDDCSIRVALAQTSFSRLGRRLGATDKRSHWPIRLNQTSLFRRAIAVRFYRKKRSDSEIFSTIL